MRRKKCLATITCDLLCASSLLAVYTYSFVGVAHAKIAPKSRFWALCASCEQFRTETLLTVFLSAIRVKNLKILDLCNTYPQDCWTHAAKNVV